MFICLSVRHQPALVLNLPNVRLFLQNSEAKQRKTSLQKALEKAKVGREDTVRTFSSACPAAQKYVICFQLRL